MDGKQTFVAGAGAALVLVNFWTGTDHQAVTGGLFGSGSTADAHKGLIKVGGEILFVAAAALLAGISDSFGTVMVLVIVALFILWAMHRYGGAQPAQTQQTAA